MEIEQREIVWPPVSEVTKRCLARQPRFIPPSKNDPKKKQLKCTRCGSRWNRNEMVEIIRGKDKKQKYYPCPDCDRDMVRKPRRV